MDYHIETIRVLNDLEINGRKASEVMGISHSLFGNKFNDKYRNKFSEDNYSVLIKWLQEYIRNL